MQKWSFFLCLFFALSLSAQNTVDPAVEEQLAPIDSQRDVDDSISRYWKFHHAAYTGYRRDRQQFNAYGAGLNDERVKIKDRNSVQVMVSSHAEFKDVVTYIRGSYAWLVNGYTDLRFPAQNLSFPHFDMGAGYVAEAKAAIGYRLKLYYKTNFGFSFIPGVGYRYASVMNFSEGNVRISTGPDQFDSAQMPNPNHQDWFGFFADGRVELRFGDICEWLLSCQYHQPYMISKMNSQFEAYTGETQLNQLNTVFRAPTSRMLLFMSDTKFNYGSGWSFGLNFEAASTWCHKATQKMVLKQEVYGSLETQSRSTAQASLQWTFYTLSFRVGRAF